VNFVSHLFSNLQSGIFGVRNSPLRIILLRVKRTEYIKSRLENVLLFWWLCYSGHFGDGVEDVGVSEV
jgi:hypothetical protein